MIASGRSSAWTSAGEAVSGTSLVHPHNIAASSAAHSSSESYPASMLYTMLCVAANNKLAQWPAYPKQEQKEVCPYTRQNAHRKWPPARARESPSMGRAGVIRHLRARLTQVCPIACDCQSRLPPVPTLVDGCLRCTCTHTISASPHRDAAHCHARAATRRTNDLCRCCPKRCHRFLQYSHGCA